MVGHRKLRQNEQSASLIGNKPLAFTYPKKVSFQPRTPLPGTAFAPRGAFLRDVPRNDPRSEGRQAVRAACRRRGAGERPKAVEDRR